MGSILKPRLMLGFFGLILLCGIKEVKGAARYYDFVLQESNFTRMCTTKSMLTVNGAFPGPTLTVRKGETFYVNVHNEGSYGVTIHWHGVKQPRNPWSDGPENITQCPIQPGTNFTYQVILSTEEGTLWWHAHNDWTRATVYGAIVILPNNGIFHKTKTPDAQQTIILGSWFNGDPRQMVLDGLASGADPGKEDGYTINGQPGDLYDCSNDTTFRMNVTFGKTYMLRIINAVVNDEMFFGIANHTLTVIGQDAAYVKPFTTNYIMITPGQTFDVQVKANQTPSYYYMAASPFVSGTRQTFSNTTTTAIFQYNGSNVTRPADMPLPILPDVTNETAAGNFTDQLKSLDSYGHPFDLPKTINKRIVIAIAINFINCEDASCSAGNFAALGASLNNVSFQTQNVSILQAYYNNLNGVYDTDFPDNPTDSYNFTGDTSNVSPFTVHGTKVKVLNYFDKVEIVFQGTSLLSAGNHPMHIHGFSSYRVGSGIGNWNNATDPQNYNLNNPPLINTWGVPKGGWVAVRFVANNPGVWFIHCHIDKHAAWGMQTVLIVRNGNSTATKVRDPPSGMPTCSA